MLIEILFGLLVLVVAALMVLDLVRTSSEGGHGHADGSARDARPAIVGAAYDGRSGAFPESARTGTPVTTHDAGPARHPETISPSASRYQDSRTSPSTAISRSSRELKNWHVRSRLLLLLIVPAVTVGAVALCIVFIASTLHGTSTRSSSSAVPAALTVGAVVIIVLASWFMIVVARSVLRPLHKLEVGAQEVAGTRLPDAIRRSGESNGQDVLSGMAPIEVDSSDEIGEVARSFDQMRTELVRLTANEAALRGRLDAMFVNLSHRSQSLVERQIRCLEALEQGEQDTERLASLVRMNRIAARMYRNSQNLLILAGHEPSSSWNTPVALANVIRAAVSEIEGYERVALNAQPDIAVRGPAVNDVVHLFAELIENAASFSAADMAVDISGRLLTSGGALVDITDRGIGMGEKELAYANWQLENPPRGDIDIPKWMGLFVVARLAARHAVRVRLQSAEFGGLTALVWLPDEVITRQGAAASPRLSGFRGSGAGPGLHEAPVDSSRVTAEQTATPARSMEFASLRDDGRDTSAGGRLLSSPARPGPTWSASSQWPTDEAELSTSASAPSGPAGSMSLEMSSDYASVVVPPAEGPAKAGGPPIYDSVESLWFSRDGRTAPAPSGRAAVAESRWSSPADEGWRAAETVDSPSSSGSTAAGLPKRQPNANLIPGVIPASQPVVPNRSAAAARDRLAGFQRGVTEARAASGGAANPDEPDES